MAELQIVPHHALSDTSSFMTGSPDKSTNPEQQQQRRRRTPAPSVCRPWPIDEDSSSTQGGALSPYSSPNGSELRSAPCGGNLPSCGACGLRVLLAGPDGVCCRLSTNGGAWTEPWRLCIDWADLADVTRASPTDLAVITVAGTSRPLALVLLDTHDLVAVPLPAITNANDADDALPSLSTPGAPFVLLGPGVLPSGPIGAQAERGEGLEFDTAAAQLAVQHAAALAIHGAADASSSRASSTLHPRSGFDSRTASMVRVTATSAAAASHGGHFKGPVPLVDVAALHPKNNHCTTPHHGAGEQHSLLVGLRAEAEQHVVQSFANTTERLVAGHVTLHGTGIVTVRREGNRFIASLSHVVFLAPNAADGAASTAAMRRGTCLPATHVDGLTALATPAGVNVYRRSCGSAGPPCWHSVAFAVASLPTCLLLPAAPQDAASFASPLRSSPSTTSNPNARLDRSRHSDAAAANASSVMIHGAADTTPRLLVVGTERGTVVVVRDDDVLQPLPTGAGASGAGSFAHGGTRKPTASTTVQLPAGIAATAISAMHPLPGSAGALIAVASTRCLVAVVSLSPATALYYIDARDIFGGGVAAFAPFRATTAPQNAEPSPIHPTRPTNTDDAANKASKPHSHHTSRAHDATDAAAVILQSGLVVTTTERDVLLLCNAPRAADGDTVVVAHGEPLVPVRSTESLWNFRPDPTWGSLAAFVPTAPSDDAGDGGRLQNLAPVATDEHFDHLRVLGSGSFGTVFLSRLRQHREDGDTTAASVVVPRYFAVKVMAIPPGLADEAGMAHNERIFAQEVLNVDRLPPHPATVTYRGAYRDGPHRRAIVMELCAGTLSDEAFREWPRRYPALPTTATTTGSDAAADRHPAASAAPPMIPEPIIAGWLGELLGGLSHLHARGILHRDVKPDNVLLTPEGRVQWADFGVSFVRRATASDPASRGPLSATASRGGAAPGSGERTRTIPPPPPTPPSARVDMPRSLVGTRTYQAPELQAQHGGAYAVYGPAADVWALGAVMYCILTGREEGMLRGAPDAAVVRDGAYPSLLSLKSVAMKCDGVASHGGGAAGEAEDSVLADAAMLDEFERREAAEALTASAGRFMDNADEVLRIGGALASYSDAFLRLVDALMATHPADRPSCREALASAVFDVGFFDAPGPAERDASSYVSSRGGSGNGREPSSPHCHTAANSANGSPLLLRRSGTFGQRQGFLAPSRTVATALISATTVAPGYVPRGLGGDSSIHDGCADGRSAEADASLGYRLSRAFVVGTGTNPSNVVTGDHHVVTCEYSAPGAPRLQALQRTSVSSLSASRRDLLVQWAATLCALPDRASPEPLPGDHTKQTYGEIVLRPVAFETPVPAAAAAAAAATRVASFSSTTPPPRLQEGEAAVTWECVAPSLSTGMPLRRWLAQSATDRLTLIAQLTALSHQCARQLAVLHTRGRTAHGSVRVAAITVAPATAFDESRFVLPAPVPPQVASSQPEAGALALHHQAAKRDVMDLAVGVTQLWRESIADADDAPTPMTNWPGLCARAYREAVGREARLGQQQQPL